MLKVRGKTLGRVSLDSRFPQLLALGVQGTRNRILLVIVDSCVSHGQSINLPLCQAPCGLSIVGSCCLTRCFRVLRWHTNQSQAGCIEHLVRERVASLPIAVLVRAIMQFNPENRPTVVLPHQQKTDVLRRDPVQRTRLLRILYAR